MCGRYAFLPDDMGPAMKRIIAMLNREDAAKMAQGDVHPGDTALVLVSESGKAVPKVMRWGMPLPEEPRLVINARAESAEQKGMFAGLVRQNCCLIPASLYYEWLRTEAHTRMKVEDEVDLYIAGLYRRSLDPAVECECVVLTKPAVGQVAAIHDRMPMILPDKADRRAWMNDEQAARAMLKQPPEVNCRVQADEPEQMDMFALFDMLEI